MEFNVTKPPFHDINVRKALNDAINKDDVTQTALDGLGEPARVPLPPSIWGYCHGIKDYGPGHDPSRGSNRAGSQRTTACCRRTALRGRSRQWRER
jgi:ABC-type transport system substrate-binding protein